MNKVSKYVFVTLAASIVMTACSKEDVFEGGESNDRIEVLFSSNITGNVTEKPSSRAAGAVWDSNDAIGIYMVEANSYTVTHGVSNYKYTTTAVGDTGRFTAASNKIYYPVTTPSTVDFISYYPHSAVASLNDLEYPIALATQTPQSGIDLLYSNNAKGKTKADTTINLAFKHQLTKVEFTIIPGEGTTTAELTSMEVSIKGFNTTAKFDLKTGTISDEGTPAAIVIDKTTPGVLYSAIVLPTTVAEGEASVEFKVGDDIYIWKIPANTEFKASSKHQYAVTINRTGITVTGTIVDWAIENGGSIIAD